MHTDQEKEKPVCFATPSFAFRSTILFTLFLSLTCGIFGIRHHLGSFPADHPHSFFGDAGDGLFNLWVLEHAANHAIRGGDALSDGRIFWPENHDTFWWSDNLLVPSMVFRAARRVLSDRFAAYWLTTQLYSAVFYVVCCLFLTRIWKSVCIRQGMPASRTVLLIPLIAYLAAFSNIRLLEIRHFQFHAASVPLLLLVTGCMDFVGKPSKRSVSLIAVSELLLLYTAPYMAVLGACMLLVWFGVVLTERLDTPGTFLKTYWPILFSALILFVPGLRPYMMTNLITYERSEIIRLSMMPAHVLFSFRTWGLPDLPGFSGLPGGATPGSGLAVAAFAGLLASLIRYRDHLIQVLRRRTTWIWVILFLLTLLDIREVKPLFALLRLALWGGLAVYIIGRRRAKETPECRTLFLLLVFTVLVYGIALGPDRNFEFQWLDPGIWGVFSRIIPGFGNMRQVIRFATLGQTLALGLFLWGLLRTFSMKGIGPLCLRAVLIGALTLQIAETVTGRAPQTRVDPGKLEHSARAQEFFNAFQGSLLVIPSTPFQLNTYAMLRMSSSPLVILVNGYSARSSQFLDELMRIERETGHGSAEQIELARNAGVDAVCLIKRHISPKNLTALQEEQQIMYNDDFLLVIRL